MFLINNIYTMSVHYKVFLVVMQMFKVTFFVYSFLKCVWWCIYMYSKLGFSFEHILNILYELFCQSDHSEQKLCLLHDPMNKVSQKQWDYPNLEILNKYS